MYGIGWSFCSSLSVCPIRSVPFVLLLQETQAFQPQSCQGGAKVPRQFCQGGHGSNCYSDNFRKIQRENAKWTGAIIYIWCFIVLLPPGVPVKACTTVSVDK